MSLFSTNYFPLLVNIVNVVLYMQDIQVHTCKHTPTNNDSHNDAQWKWSLRGGGTQREESD